ncbi:hypothetical protein GOC13_22915 [Sinorhizobium meliloti]|nr:hypothetical protein [Sinorhizobium meliloti]MDX0270608.1 hypothetical protein [Sinorhizobium meliloti]
MLPNAVKKPLRYSRVSRYLSKNDVSKPDVALSALTAGKYSPGALVFGFDLGTKKRSEWVIVTVTSPDFLELARAMYSSDPDAAKSAFSSVMSENI